MGKSEALVNRAKTSLKQTLKMNYLYFVVDRKSGAKRGESFEKRPPLEGKSLQAWCQATGSTVPHLSDLPNRHQGRNDRT
jgi:hypothetical protein